MVCFERADIRLGAGIRPAAVGQGAFARGGRYSAITRGRAHGRGSVGLQEKAIEGLDKTIKNGLDNVFKMPMISEKAF